MHARKHTENIDVQENNSENTMKHITHMSRSHVNRHK